MYARSTAQIADDALMQPHSWTLVLVEPGREEGAAHRLSGALAFALSREGEEAGRSHILSAGAPLSEAIVALPERDVVLLRGLHTLADPEIVSLDQRRDSLATGPRVIAVLPSGGEGRLRTLAPHLWSWLSARIWVLERYDSPTVRHPGHILRQDFMAPLGLHPTQVARDLGITRRRLDGLLAGKQALTPELAARLGAFFQTPARWWLVMQAEHDAARVDMDRALVARVHPLDLGPDAMITPTGVMWLTEPASGPLQAGATLVTYEHGGVALVGREP